MTKQSLIDTSYRIETPEGVILMLQPASFVARSMALLIDMLCQAMLFLLLVIIAVVLSILETFFVDFGDSLMWGLMVITGFLIYWWYFVFFEVLFKGQTPGKKMMNLKVINDDATPIGWSASMIRNLLRVVDMMPAITYSVGFLTTVSHPQFKRLGDIAAGTLVIYKTPANPFKGKHPPNIEAESPALLLSIEEQKLIISFALRYQDLSASRRAEIVESLSNIALTHNIDLSTEESIYAIANTLLGNTSVDRNVTESSKPEALIP